MDAIRYIVFVVYRAIFVELDNFQRMRKAAFDALIKSDFLCLPICYSERSATTASFRDAIFAGMWPPNMVRIVLIATNRTACPI